MTGMLKTEVMAFERVEDRVLLERGTDPFDEESGETFLGGIVSRGLATSIEEKFGGDHSLLVGFGSKGRSRGGRGGGNRYGFGA
jgi:hypothetical protein